MGKPVKIRKRNSFMFTTKHHSGYGIMGLVIFLLGAAAFTLCVITSYQSRGSVEINLGGVGFFGTALNIVGVICSAFALKERDVFLTEPIIALSGNGIVIIMWGLSVFMALKG